ncbi:MAG: ACT domain-containing protein [SAR324 cluster bacterium]|nr:ACT domain-containing protein [SAR324 cluster bacterium]
MTGLLTGLTAPLADAGIFVFAVSTVDTDYLLVRKGSFERAVAVLRGKGHTVLEKQAANKIGEGQQEIKK